MLNLTPFILLLPLIGFVALGLFGRGLPRAVISLVGCGVVLAAFVLACLDFAALLAGPRGTSSVILWNWVTSGSLRIDFRLLSDPLSAVMLLIVTGVGFLIHVYSIGYMHDDPSYWRFFAFLNFFVFAMTLLIAADSFLFLLVGWGGVGLASFLLIGFWYTRPAAVAAAKKAFVVNVIGDFGLMLAIFLLFITFGTLDYGSILGHAGAATSSVVFSTPVLDTGRLTAIALLLFLACVAKSAQLPLHVWLPDAMEGPTPVSALIHAATMVTAGVYLVARAAPLFLAAPDALAVVGIVGGASALFAATLACVQTDIKRVLAYSTMSQLGYMFMGEAAGGFSTGIFHLTTHAYFKALLFMCAGAVIHALGGEQDMRKMGGLARRMRWTFRFFLAGGLALAAIVPFAGFWSKDAILGALLQQGISSGAAGWYVLYAVGLLTAILTGFYVFRLIFAVFLGSYRGGEIAVHGAQDGHGAVAPATRRGAAAGGGRDPLARVHEVGPAMLVPMAVLAVLAVIGGLDGTPWGDAFGTFLNPIFAGTSARLASQHVAVVSPGLLVGSGAFWLSLAAGLVCGLLGIGLAWLLYGRREPSFAPSRNPFVVLLEHRYYVDDLYTLALVRPLVWLGGALRRLVEDDALDGGTRGVGRVVGGVSSGLRALQTGYARTYALGIFLGAALILLYYIARR